MTVQTYRPTLSAGQVYMRVAGSAAPLRPVGNVSILAINVAEEEKVLQDYTKPGGGQWAAVSRVTGITADMTLHDLDPTNLALALYGTESAVVGSTVVAAEVTGYQGGLIRLAHPNPTSVTVTSDPAGTTYVADTDYEVLPEGILILEGSIADATDLLVSYTYGAYDVVQALTGAGAQYELSFGGLNEANSNSPVVVDIFKLKISAAKKLDLIGQDFAALELSGKVLLDATKTGAGVSQYFRTQMV